MWGYETMIGCGMAMVGRYVSILVYTTRLSTATTPQCDLPEEPETRRFPWPPLVRKW